MNKRKLLLRIINNYKNVRFDDFVVIVEAFEFYLARTNGSHNIFKNSAINETINIRPLRKLILRKIIAVKALFRKEGGSRVSG